MTPLLMRTFVDRSVGAGQELITLLVDCYVRGVTTAQVGRDMRRV